MKKKAPVIVIAVLLALVVAISTVYVVGKVNYKHGKELGYLIGYSMGRTDKASGVTADPGTLGHVVVPYELGSAKWKGFVMGFPTGYDDGYSGVLVMD